MIVAPTKLEKLLISEVSVVDDPANEIPGFMIMKAATEEVDKDQKFATGRPIGPDQVWDVGAADARVRDKTGATDAPNSAYAKCFLWFDGDAPDEDGNGVPDRFGDYKFLVVDVADGDLKIMPRAVRAAASRLPNSTIPAGDKDTARALIDKIQARIESTSKANEDTTSIIGKIKNLLPLGKDEVDMTKDELNAVLDERFTALSTTLAESLSKSVEAPPTEGTPAVTPETAPAATTTEAETALTVEDVSKGIEAAVDPLFEVLDKTLDRIERIEKLLSIRKSLDGQEGTTEGEAKPTLKDAIGAALTGRAVTLK